MAFTDTVRNSYRTMINAIKAAGLFKEERYIYSPQCSEIEVEFTQGSVIKRCINICANNYLGLSSHPDVIAAAHAGLESRGYGM
jgi:glycine C-acetyltransferase